MRKFLVLCFCCSPVLGLAQTSDERDFIDGVRAELATVTDSVALIRRESLTIEVARIERDSALIHLELGLIAYRLGEITGGDRHYDEAAGEFEWTVDLRPDWVWGHYGQALSEFALGEHRIISIENLRQLFGADYISETVEALFSATEAEPGFVPALEMLAEIAPRQRFRRPIDDVFAAFETALESDAANDPALHLAYGRFVRDRADYERALVAFRRAIELGGRSPARLLELGRTQFALGMDRQGRANYYEAARTLRSSEARELFREDLVWIASRLELREYDGLSQFDVEPWLREFWERRALMEFRRPGERVAEHFRRYYHAVQNHRLFSRNRRVLTFLPYRPDQDVVDDMGVVYVRHGEPVDQITYRYVGEASQHTWGYPGRERRTVLHFVSGNTLYGETTIGRDYRLVESVGADRYRAEVIRDLDPIYQRLSGGLGTTRASYVATERIMVRENIILATTTDSYPIRFDTNVDAIRRVFMFSGGSAEEGTAVIALAVPGELFPSRSDEGGDRFAYPVDIRVIGIGADNLVVDLLDTTRVFIAPGGLEPGTAFLAAFEVPLFAEAPQLGILISDSARTVGAVMRTEPLTPPGLLAGSIDVSDLLLGSSVLDIFWESRDVRVNPVDVYTRGTAVDVYYEVYGLERGQVYDVELTVERKRGGIGGFFSRLFGGGPEIRLAFQGRADGLATEVRQRLELAELGRGDYTVSLKVRFEDADSIERARVITVIE